MSQTEFVSYVGPRKIHDATIENLDRKHDTLEVSLTTQDGQRLCVLFHKVSEVKGIEPVGMLLYSLSELRAPVGRHFVFTNWDDDGTAALEVWAEDVTWAFG